MNRPGRALAVLALSAGTLAYEVLLVRVFAVEQFHHFAYLAVGVAMLGLGASGTLVALVRARRAFDADRWLRLSTLLTPLALLAAPAVSDLFPMDPTRLAWDAGQWVRLGLLQAALAVPFATGAAGTLAALVGEGGRPGLVYGAGFAGAGIGAAAGVAVLAVLDPVRALAVPALLAAPAALGVARSTGRLRWAGVAAACGVAGAGAVARPPWRLDLLPYKGLAQVRAFPGAHVVAERTGPTGWVVAVRASAFRLAPGLSLAYRGAFPPQTALFVDGELAGALSRWTATSLTLLDWQPSALPYALGERRRVLLLTAGGAHEVASALAHGAAAITVVEPVRGVAELARAGLTEAFGRDPATVRWVVGDQRAYLARARARYDLVTLGPFAGGAPGAGAGAVSLREDFTRTVEGVARALAVLAPDGVLAVTDWLTLPPRAEVRTVLTAAAALRRVAPDRVRDGLVVVRSWGTVTTLVKPDGFGPGELDALAAWAAERRFDVDWRPGLAAPAARFNLLEEPALFHAARAASGGEASAARYAAGYPFDVRPASDARPYPHTFLGHRTLRLLRDRALGDWLPFAEWGYVAVLATLAQSAVLAAALLALPAALLRRTPVGRRRLLGYFGALGFGYLLAEIAAIQQLTLLLGYPVYAVAAVLAALLVGSGVGSAWSDGLAASRAPHVALALAVACGALAAGLMPLVHAVGGSGLGVRGLVAAVTLVPLAVAMGMPFPLGLRGLAGDDAGRVAWAWAANGFASVVAAPLAALIALEAGSAAVFAAAAVAYGLAGRVVSGGRLEGGVAGAWGA